MEFKHKSVLLEETIEMLNIKKNGIYVDATLGGGGHSLEILKKLDDGILIAIDQDIDALNSTKEKLKTYSDKIRYFHGNFSEIEQYLNSLKIKKIDGIIADLGVSSYQFDNGERGFSYNHNAKLDMRMNRDNKLSAYDVINNYTESELTKIFYDYGEEKWGSRIANFIINKRKEEPINTTFQLVEIIKNAIPKAVRENGSHPAKKVFQAIRIEVNKELDKITPLIDNAINFLNIKGRICIITFHSLEDRIVKNKFKEYEMNCICPKEYPICTCQKVRELKIITKKPIIPSNSEINDNLRARSAKLRVAEKL